jgi:hypothetical protein
LLATGTTVLPGAEREAEDEIWVRILFNWLSDRRLIVEGPKGMFSAEAASWAECSVSSC